MKVIYNIEDWKEDGIVATIGFFDGVHHGHRFLLSEMQETAKKKGLPSAVITFSRHPRVVLNSDYQPKLLNSFDEKIELLSKTGIDYIIVLDFTPELASLSAHEFITDELAAKWHVRTLLIGYDHRFGHLRADGFEQYLVYGKECGIEVIKASSYSEKGLAVSSTKIRNLILQGDVAIVSQLLGYPYHLNGHVIAGNKVGRSIGFPTANITVDEKYKVIPLHGSYAVWIEIDDMRYKGMLYIGPRPTLEDDGDISIEANIFDFSENIYGKSVTIEFVDFIRKNTKFDSLDELVRQMYADKQIAENKLTT